MQLAVPEHAAASARAVASGPRYSRTPASRSLNQVANYEIGDSQTVNESDANGVDTTN